MIEIELPYIDKILVSKKRNPKYYSLTSGVGRKIIKEGSRVSKKVGLGIYKVNSNFFILDENGEKIVSNIRTVGKPKFWVVNFQDIYNNIIRFQARNTIIIKLKNEFLPWIDRSTLHEVDFTNWYPLKIELFIFSKEMPVDVDNKGALYFKIFQDIIKDKYIKDDSSEFINDTGRVKWIKINEDQEEKMIFRITKSNNEYE